MINNHKNESIDDAGDFCTCIEYAKKDRTP